MTAVRFVGERFSVSEIGGEPLVGAGPAIKREVFSFVVTGGFGVDAGLVFGDVAVDFNGIVGVSAIRVDPVHAVGQVRVVLGEIFAGLGGIFLGSGLEGRLLDDIGNVDESLEGLVVAKLLGNLVDRLVRGGRGGGGRSLRAGLEKSLELSRSKSTTRSGLSRRSWWTS